MLKNLRLRNLKKQLLKKIKSKLLEEKKKDTKIVKIFKKYFGEDLTGTYEGTYVREERTQMYITLRGYLNTMQKGVTKTPSEKKKRSKKVQTLKTLIQSAIL